MPAKAADSGDPFISDDLKCLQKSLAIFEEDCMNKNLTKLFNEL